MKTFSQVVLSRIVGILWHTAVNYFKAFNNVLKSSFCRTEGTVGILTAKAPPLPSIIIIM